MGVLADWQIEQSGIVFPCEPGQKRPGVISYGVSSYGYDARVGYKFKLFSNVNGSVVDPKAFDPKAFVSVDLTPRGHAYHRHFRDMTTPRTWQCCDCFCEVPYESENNRPEPGTCPAKEQPKDHILIPPNSFCLAESFERFDIPRDMLAVVVGKSTYARCGIIVNVTPLEPCWRGVVTIEISNTTPLPAKIYAGEGICQVLFLRSDALRVEMDRAIRDILSSNIAPRVCPRQYEELMALASCRTSYADKQGVYQDQTGLTLPRVAGEQL